jgi:hypothetical protein
MYDNISPALPFNTSFVLDVNGTIIFVTLLKEPKKVNGDSEEKK